MRNITSKILVVVLFCTATFSGLYAQGIAFNHDSFSAAVKAAAQERKLVFMDCYTSVSYTHLTLPTNREV